jgi:phosphoglycerate dehydrogenase-like enzyme
VRVVASLPTPQLLDDVRTLLPASVEAELVLWTGDGAPPRDCIDIVVPPYLRQRELLPRIAMLRHRLIQSQSIGFDGVADRLPAGSAYANAAGVHETATAELAVALLLAAQRGMHESFSAQERQDWTHGWTPGLADRRIVLLGYGGVGRAIADRLSGFEVELVVVASYARVEHGVRVHSAQDLRNLLPGADILISAVPGGPATDRMIDDAVLSALPEGALLVNVGRGRTVDTPALVEHVRRRGIRVASDVFDPEPLPAGHPLWSLPGVIIAPHAGGRTAAMRPRMARLVALQIERMARGEEPVNVVLRS